VSVQWSFLLGLLELYAFWPVTGQSAARRNPITHEALGPREFAFLVRPNLIPGGQMLWVAVAGANTQPATFVGVALR
jgi:hypothetical protein